MGYKHKDLIGTRELSKEEILYFLEAAKEFKELNLSQVKKNDYLRGKTTINAFYENSTRTRTSFEIAAKRLGADTINFNSSSSSVTKGESLNDTMNNMAAMRTDIIVLRHPSSGAAKFAADRTDASVVNAGDGTNEHPSQALLDLFTLREHGKILDKNFDFKKIIYPEDLEHLVSEFNLKRRVFSVSKKQQFETLKSCRIIRKDGEIVPYSLCLKFVSNGSEISEIIGYFMDSNMACKNNMMCKASSSRTKI